MAQPRELEVLYQDEDFVVVNKPHDVKINSDVKTDVTVETLLTSRGVSAVSATPLAHSFYFMHRLDYATSGVLCIGLTKQAARIGVRCFTNRLARKLYLALLRGHVECDKTVLLRKPHAVCRDGSNGLSMRIDIGIGRCETTDFPNFYTTADKAECLKPVEATTDVHILQLGHYDGAPATKVMFVPHTGRSHQLRVHAAYIGHTVIGDFTYSYRQDTEPSRMMLHSHRLVLPCSIRHIDVTAPDPFITDPLWQPQITLLEQDQLAVALLHENNTMSVFQ